jgi:hypothetical protein
MWKVENTVKLTKFRKDYVAGFAIIFFIAIVFCEIMMAIWLPVHLRTTNVWALQVARQDMLDMFDELRKGFSSVSGNAQVEGEANIIAKNLDALAIYVRDYQADLSQTQIEEIRSDLENFQSILYNLQKGIPYAKATKLDPSPFIDKLIQTGMKPPGSGAEK